MISFVYTLISLGNLSAEHSRTMFLSWSFSIFSVVFLLPNPSYAVAVATVDIPAYFRGHPADRVLPAYGAIITAAPVLDEKLLEKRGLATCGYISGNPSKPRISDSTLPLPLTILLPRSPYNMSRRIHLHEYIRIQSSVGMLRPASMCRQL